MTTLICPCCGENYHVNVEVQTGRKVFCGRCQRKHIYYNYSLVPFALELAPKGNDRRISCPFCQRHFFIDTFSIGEYCCTACGTAFYVSQKPEIYAPGVEPGQSVVAPPAPPPGVTIPPPEKLPAEAYTGCATAPLLDAPLELPTGEVAPADKPVLQDVSAEEEDSEHRKVASAVTVRIPENADEAIRIKPAHLPDIMAGKTPETEPEKTENKKSGIKLLKLDLKKR